MKDLLPAEVAMGPPIQDESISVKPGENNTHQWPKTHFLKEELSRLARLAQCDTSSVKPRLRLLYSPELAGPPSIRLFEPDGKREMICDHEALRTRANRM